MSASQAAHRRTLATALDDFEQHTLTGGSTTTAVAATLINATTGVSSGLYEGAWIYHRSGTNAPQISRITAYVPSTGTLTFSPALSALSSGGTIEISRVFPAIPAPGSDTDYQTIANKSLKHWLMIDCERTQLVTASDEYPTLPAGLDRPERLKKVLEPSPVSGRAPLDTTRARGWDLIADEETPKLRCKVPFSTVTGSITVVCDLPAVNWIKVSATWASSLVGFVNETDEAVPETEELAPIQLMVAYEALMARSANGFPTDPQAHQKFIEYREMARGLQHFDQTQERVRVAPPGHASQAVLASDAVAA